MRSFVTVTKSGFQIYTFLRKKERKKGLAVAVGVMVEEGQGSCVASKRGGVSGSHVGSEYVQY